MLSIWRIDLRPSLHLVLKSCASGHVGPVCMVYDGARVDDIHCDNKGGAFVLGSLIELGVLSFEFVCSARTGKLLGGPGQVLRRVVTARTLIVTTILTTSPGPPSMAASRSMASLLIYVISYGNPTGLVHPCPGPPTYR